MNEIAARPLVGTQVDGDLLPRPDEAAALSGLIGDIYDAAIRSEGWPDVLRAVRDYVGGMAANLYAKRGKKLARGVYHTDGGITAHWAGLYTAQYVTLDPATEGELQTEIGGTVSTSDVADLEEYVQTRFYREWQRPQGIVDFICAPLSRAGDRTAMLCIFRHERDGMVDAAARRRMRLIVPHIRRAVHISEIIEARTHEAGLFRDALDGLSAGLFFVDPRSRIVHTNRAGGDMLSEGRAVVSRQGRLGAVERPAATELAEAAEAAGAGDQAIGARGISVPIAAQDGDRFAAHVLPLTCGDRRRTGADHAAAAAIFVQRAALETPAASQLVARAFCLTPAEERVLAGIVDNGGVAETAEALGIGEATVKTHLHRVFAKTDTRRQADLVKLIAAYSTPLSR